MLFKELEPITYMCLHGGVLETDGHAGEVFRAQPDHRLVYIHQYSLLDRLVFHDFP